ncbi:hypothetical protein BDV98DRAFT_573799 [Pterulicium gracile]|uniref:Cupredoxin n=1 Tax=Pterulicium gracile TaxID=1884261 RepID=A0A5C3Q6T1_9AGAR|nr:hypothetical protein BDV98DRAFT_573799 [Pterula gracilis]
MKLSVVSSVLLSASSAFAFDYVIGVGKDERTGRKGMGFDPSSIHPSAGDTIVFEFRSGDHSAVQSSFASPCAGIDGGFNSGVQTVGDDLEVDAPGLPQIRLLVNDTQPLWFFDEAAGLCRDGAVFSVNPTQEQSPGVFVENAKNSPETPAPSDSDSEDSGSPDESAGGDGPAPTSDDSEGAALRVVAGMIWLGVLAPAFML